MNKQKSVEANGPDVESAIQLGLMMLGVSRDEVDVEVLEKESGGFLGLFGSSDARVRLTIREEGAAPAPQPAITEEPEEIVEEEQAPESEAEEIQEEVEAEEPPEPERPLTEEEKLEAEIAELMGAFDSSPAPAAEPSKTPEPAEKPMEVLYESEEYEEEEEVKAEVQPQPQALPKAEPEPKPEPVAAKSEESYDDYDDYEDEDEESYFVGDEEYDEEELADELDEDAAIGSATLRELLEKLGIHAQIKISRAWSAPDEKREAPWLLDIRGRDLGILIGRRGETLAALQYITRIIASRELQRRVNIVIDVEGYKNRRARILQRLAREKAEDALSSGETVIMEPMPPYERRIIHVELRNHPRVTTESVGQGDRRRVTVIPKK
jgi:spoIIIJ-associated protein